MRVKTGLAALMCAALSACGGGGSDNSASPAPAPTPPPSPSPVPVNVSLTLSTTQLTRTLAAGDELEFNIEGAWSGNPSSEPFLQVQDAAGRFSTLARLTRLPNRGFSLAFDSLPSVPAGVHAGTLAVRACKDTACVEPYAGASASVSYELTVEAVDDWGTFQRNAAHTGYVPITLNPARFRQVWTWTRPLDDPIGGINPVVAAQGKVYVTKDVYFGPAALYALDEATGAEAWKVSFGTMPALNPPAVAGGRVHVATTGHENTYLWTFDAASGSFVGKSQFYGQWPHVLAPTIYGDEVFTNGGYYGGQVYAFSLANGSGTWASPSVGDDDMSTPAVDARNIYYHTGKFLQIWDRATRASVATIEDPFANPSGYSYHGAPVIGARNNVISFAGSAFSGLASANAEQYELRVLSSFNVGTNSFEWASSSAYKTAPALANGVIYAGGSSPLSLDAIDETTGRVLWSWRGTAQDSAFHRNVIATRNLLFVSTDRAVFAIDLATRTPVWSHPEPGMLALSASRVLYIATGATQSNGKLVAIKLN